MYIRKLRNKKTILIGIELLVSCEKYNTNVGNKSLVSKQARIYMDKPLNRLRSITVYNGNMNRKTAYTNLTCGNKNRCYTTVTNAALYIKVDKLSFTFKCILPVADRVLDSVPTSLSTSVFSVISNRALVLEKRLKNEVKIKSLNWGIFFYGVEVNIVDYTCIVHTSHANLTVNGVVHKCEVIYYIEVRSITNMTEGTKNLCICDFVCYYDVVCPKELTQAEPIWIKTFKTVWKGLSDAELEIIKNNISRSYVTLWEMNIFEQMHLPEKD